MFDLIRQMHLSHGLIKQEQSAGVSLLTSTDTSPQNVYGDQESLSLIYEKQELVFRCIKFYADNLAAIPLKVQRINKDKEDEVIADYTDLPLFKIFQKPNEHQTKTEFWVESLSRLLLQGELFWPMILSELGVPEQVFADWKSEEVKVVPDTKEKVKGFLLMRNGKQFSIPKDEVFYTYFFNPYNQYRGLSYLRAMRDSIVLDLQAVAFNKNFFKQGMRFSGVLSTEKPMKEDEAKRFQQKFEQMYRSTDNMHRVAVLWNGLKFDPIQSMSLNDAQFKDLRIMNRDNIIAGFGLFPEVVGFGQRTYENVKFYRRMAWTETLKPFMNRMTDLLTQKFLPRFIDTQKNPDVRVIADYSKVEALKEERSSKMEDYKKGEKSLTYNEIRVDVFKKERHEDERMDIPIGLLEMDQKSAANPPAKSNKYSEELHANTPELRTKIWQEKIKSIESQEEKMLPKIRRFFDKQRSRVAGSIDSYVKTPLTSENVLFDLRQENLLLITEGAKWIAEPFNEAVQELMKSLEAGTFDYELPSVRYALGQRVKKLSTFINSKTDKDIKAVVQKVFDEYGGQDIAVIRDALKDAVRDLYKGFKDSRAELIARTESVGAWNMGQQEALQQAAAKKKIDNKMWLTSRDDKVRDSHLIDGQVVGVNEMFRLQDGSEMLYPHDFNERCVEIPTREKRTND